MNPRALDRLSEPGKPWPMGVTPRTVAGQEGVNAVVFAPHAHAVMVCVFDAEGHREIERWHLRCHGDGLWCGWIPGHGAGMLYGLRADGPWKPEQGHRYNPHRLLIDPWARALVGSTSALALECDDPQGRGFPPLPRDNAERVPKARVLDLEQELCRARSIAARPWVPWSQTVLYEAHVKSATALLPDLEPELRGTWLGLASKPMLEHYRKLGITSLCLLPVQLHLDERHLIERGLSNLWGYNTLNYFVPDPRFATPHARGERQDDQRIRDEFRQMVDGLHREGIEVILDVVYNHTAEGGATGPTLSWRGLDHAAWYALDEHGHPMNFSGCGNTLNLGEPHAVQLVMDSLRWWAEAFGVDGFRFDLAVSLGRDPRLDWRFHPAHALFTAMAQDPVLAPLKHIAEPWDLGPDGYRLGQFLPGWHEWNDRFRDTVRAWWLGHECTRGELARRLAGSSDRFEHDGRLPLASINLITAHDGFTLADLTSYRHKHNEVNGEDNRDGADANFSANAGVEGPSEDPTVLERRQQWRRALLSTLFCAQGVPQLLAGDEIGHSQRGNNNAYCQDNPISWIDWARGDADLCSFVAALTALRRELPALRHPLWFSGQWSEADLPPDIEWRTAQGYPPGVDEWEQPDSRILACVITVGEPGGLPRERVMTIFHAGSEPACVRLPEGMWHTVLDSRIGARFPRPASPDAPTAGPPGERGWTEVVPPCLKILVQPLPSGDPSP